jgi:Zn-dependent protease with chaperone function
MMMTGVAALYFDGITSRKNTVALSVREGVAYLCGDAERNCPISQLRVSERVKHGARKVTFPDGAYLEILDTAAFDAMLGMTGHQDSLVVRMQQSWRSTLAALAATVAVLVLGYLLALPALSEAIAKALPPQVERAIGRETLGFLDQHLLKPTGLPEAQRAAIVRDFKALTSARPGAPAYEIVFRKSKIGPNAFALPSGQIVLTDEIVKLVDDDQAVMGILGHELGHLQQRHMTRRLIQSSAIAGVATALFGDVSAVVANLPTLMLDMKYSRDAEREADDYAIALFQANGLSLTRLALVFEKLGKVAGEPPPYLSTHPSSVERIAHIRNAR